MKNELLKHIQQRRSVRTFLDKDIPDSKIKDILEAGRWAPSGLNNQPWRFLVIRNKDILKKLATLTKYQRIMKTCNKCIAVFYHLPSGYNRDKDLMSIGACIQNMLLVAASQQIGTVWLGEILNKKDSVNPILGVDKNNELAAMIALGYPNESPQKDRFDLEKLMLSNFY